MLSLIEELKNNFEIRQLGISAPYERLNTEWFDTHNKAVKAMVKLLKDKGYTKITLPYLPVPYVWDDSEGGYRACVPIVKNRNKEENVQKENKD